MLLHGAPWKADDKRCLGVGGSGVAKIVDEHKEKHETEWSGVCSRQIDYQDSTFGVHPKTAHKDPYEYYRYSCALSLTSELWGVGGHRHAPAALRPGMSRYPLFRKLRRPRGVFGRIRRTCLHRDLIPGLSSS